MGKVSPAEPGRGVWAPGQALLQPERMLGFGARDVCAPPSHPGLEAWRQAGGEERGCLGQARDASLGQAGGGSKASTT